MLIHEAKDGELDGLKEVKVRIPARYHMVLLSMKLLQGKQISDAVTEALDAYFENMKSRPPAPPTTRVEPESPRRVQIRRTGP